MELIDSVSYIHSSLVSACSSIVDNKSIDATVERVIERISRTRIGEYCYNELRIEFGIRIMNSEIVTC